MLDGTWSALVGGLAVLALAACTPPAERPDAQATITTDEFSRTIDIEGPLMAENPFGGIAKFYDLITRVDKATHTYSHILSVWVSYDNDPFNFQFANDDRAQALPLYRTSRAKRPCSSCDREETFDIALTDAALRSHAESGYRIRVSSLAGDHIILTISPAMIAKQFAGLDEYLRTVAAPVPGAATILSVVPAISPAPEAAHETRREPRHLGIEYQQTIKVGEIAVVYVEPGSPADEAGLQADDILLRYDGHPISDESDVQELVDDTEPGNTVEIEVRRGRERLTLTAQM